jgi:hypothetical protein
VNGIEGLQIKPYKEASQEKSSQLKHLKPRGLAVLSRSQPLGFIKESEDISKNCSPCPNHKAMNSTMLTNLRPIFSNLPENFEASYSAIIEYESDVHLE